MPELGPFAHNAAADLTLTSDPLDLRVIDRTKFKGVLFGNPTAPKAPGEESGSVEGGGGRNGNATGRNNGPGAPPAGPVRVPGVDLDFSGNELVWYGGNLSGVNEQGATPFWRAAYADDIVAMKLLVSRGADPNIPTMKGLSRPMTDDGVREYKEVGNRPAIPVGGPGVPPLVAAAGVGYGEGFAGNTHNFAPTGMMAAVKYLVEELGADVNAVDHEGNTAMHNAAARGDVEMILYLVEKGADPKAVNREGKTTADMANGPVQRIQPWPEALALLEKLGAVNNRRCVSC